MCADWVLTVFAATQASVEAEDEEEENEDEAPHAPEPSLPDPPVRPVERVELDDSDEEREDGEDHDFDVSSLVFPSEPTKTAWRDAQTADSYSSTGEEGLVSHHFYSSSCIAVV